jgi:hypothetical protein
VLLDLRLHPLGGEEVRDRQLPRGQKERGLAAAHDVRAIREEYVGVHDHGEAIPERKSEVGAAGTSRGAKTGS